MISGSGYPSDLQYCRSTFATICKAASLFLIATLIFCFADSKVTHAGEWGNWVTHPAYPNIQVRVKYYRHNQFATEPETNEWLLEIKNNNAEELSVTFDVTDTDVTTPPYLRYRKASPGILPGEVYSNSISFFVKAQEGQQVLVWLDNVVVGTTEVAPAGGGSIAIGDALNSSGGAIGSNSSSTVNDSSSAFDPCSSNPGLSLSASSVTIPEATVPPASILKATATDPSGGSCPVTLTFSADYTVSYLFNMDAAGQVTLANNLLDAAKYPLYRFSIIADNGTSSTRAYATVYVEPSPEVTIGSGQNFVVRNTDPYNTSLGVIESEYSGTPSPEFSLLGGDAGDLFIVGTYGDIRVSNQTALAAITDTTNYTLTVQATSGVYSDIKDVNVTVTINDSPVIHDQSYSVPRIMYNGYLIGRVDASDPDGAIDTLTYKYVEPDPMSINTRLPISIDLYTGQMRVTDYRYFMDHFVEPHLGFQESFQVEVSDGVNTVTKWLTIHVARNNPPDTGSIEFNMDAGKVGEPVLLGYLRASDPDGNPIRYEILSGNDDNLFTLDENGTLWGTSAVSMLPQYELWAIISDGIDESSYFVTVNVSTAPVIEDRMVYVDPYTIQNGLSVGALNAFDPDGDLLTYSLISGGSYFELDTSTGVLSFWPSYSWVDHVASEISNPPDYYSAEIEASDGLLTSRGRMYVIPVTSITDFTSTTPANNTVFYMSDCGYRARDFQITRADTSLPYGEYTIEMVPGTGDDDNHRFRVTDNPPLLVTVGADVSDLTWPNTYSVRVRVTDALGNVVEKIVGGQYEYIDSNIEPPPEQFISYEHCMQQKSLNRNLAYIGSAPVAAKQSGIQLSRNSMHVYTLDIAALSVFGVESSEEVVNGDWGNLDLVAEILDASGNLVARTFDDGQPTDQLLEGIALDAGSYYLLVSGRANSDEGYYSLQASLVEIPDTSGGSGGGGATDGGDSSNPGSGGGGGGSSNLLVIISWLGVFVFRRIKNNKTKGQSRICCPTGLLRY